MTFNPLKYNKPRTMENKYKEGETVYAHEEPALKLKVRRYVDRIYYCTVMEDTARKELVYFERELMDEAGARDMK